VRDRGGLLPACRRRWRFQPVPAAVRSAHRQVGAAVTTGRDRRNDRAGRFGLHRGHHALELPQPQLRRRLSQGHPPPAAIEESVVGGRGPPGRQAFQSSTRVATRRTDHPRRQLAGRSARAGFRWTGAGAWRTRVDGRGVPSLWPRAQRQLSACDITAGRGQQGVWPARACACWGAG